MLEAVRRALAAEIHRATATPPFDADPTLRWQMRRAAGELMASIGSGYEQEAAADSLKTLFVSAGLAAELKKTAAKESTGAAA